MAIGRGIQMSRGRNNKASAFALPTILISSIVMLMVLLVAVSSVTTTRTALNSQYYEQLAKAAGEAGVAYAEACLNANGGVPLWTDAAPLKPNTNCSGIDIVSCPTTSTNPLCSVTLNGNVRSSFSIGKPLVETPSVLVVGGGGGGGATASGGGAGGYVYSPTFDFGVGSYPVTVGAGGAGGVPAGPTSGSSGGDSTISTIVAKGGGGGVSHGGGNGLGGASGSGGAISTGTQYYGGRGIGSQGRNGGDGFIDSGWTGNNAGGGGAGGVGVSGGNSAGTGAGGAGLTNSITGTSTYYAGGGAGGEVNSTGVSNPTLGGLGGGGNANTNAAGSNATPNTGGGGGGGSYNGSYFAGGNGGSGVVIVSYPTGLLTATGGTITTSGGKTIHKFTSNGTFTVNTVTNSVKIIPNNGFVEVLRSSNKAVWRTYQQKTAPTSVVPDQCSGEAKSIYGWNNAVIQTAQTGDTISDPNALAISPGIGSVNPGPTYFRKDFSVTKAGTYNIEWLADDFGEMYIDGLFVQNATYPTVAKTSTTLGVGCHTTYIKLINRGILANPSTLKFSMKATGASIATVVSDSSWRVSAGSTVHYSSPNYYASPSWTTARDINAATAVNTNWGATSGDSTARFISSPNSYDGSGNYPSSQWTYFRDSRDIYVSASTQVRVSVVCDDNCFPYLDSSWVMSGAPYNNVYTTTLTLTPGIHKFALGLFNGSAAAGFSFAAVRTSDNVALSVSDGTWQAASFWEPTARDLYSYDNKFVPNPTNIPVSPIASVLVVAGGGGGGSRHGGGGGAGGLIYNSNFSVTSETSPVVIGGGGGGTASGASANQDTATSGGNSSIFGLVAIGGGAGRGSSTGVAGGSGGGGGPGVSGGSGILGQGYAGGSGLYSTYYMGGGGGGAGGVGSVPSYPSSTIAAGGPGVSNSITGATVTYAVGGSGGVYNTNTVGVAGAANTGNGGGGAGGETNGGATGGSGVVIISYTTGSMTATGGTITTSGGYTIHRFTSNGTFTVTSIP